MILKKQITEILNLDCFLPHVTKFVCYLVRKILEVHFYTVLATFMLLYIFQYETL